MSDLISRQAAIDALCAVCGKSCDKSEFVYNAPQDEQVILCPEHYALCTLPSAQPDVPDTNVGDMISRQAAIDAIEDTDWYHQNANKDMVSGASDEHQAWYKAGDVYKALESVPSAHPTVNTARHGHWIYRSFVDDWIGLLYICSECGDFCDSRYRFCPSCGAKMDREDGET